MAERAPDISAAQEQEWMTGAEWLAWRDHPKTQALVQWIRQGLVGRSQDAWVNGGFSTERTQLIAQGGANALLRLAVAIESIRMEEQPKQERANDE